MPPASPRLAPLVQGDDQRAFQLADELGLARLATDRVLAQLDPRQLVLGWQDDRLCLRRGGPASPGPVCVDFTSATLSHRRRGKHNELSGRAVGIAGQRQPRVLDATAGLGRDAFVLADQGCEVAMCERDPVMRALLEDGLRRATRAADAGLATTLARLQLCGEDARQCDPATLNRIQVIYLDPMFPPRSKRAAVKKDLALLQLLLGEPLPGEGESLLDWALQQAVNRVVVKRPPRAAPIPGPEPSHHIAGKAVRYDVYMLNRAVLN